MHTIAITHTYIFTWNYIAFIDYLCLYARKDMNLYLSAAVTVLLRKCTVNDIDGVAIVERYEIARQEKNTNKNVS